MDGHLSFRTTLVIIFIFIFSIISALCMRNIFSRIGYCTKKFFVAYQRVKTWARRLGFHRVPRAKLFRSLPFSDFWTCVPTNRRNKSPPLSIHYMIGFERIELKPLYTIGNYSITACPNYKVKACLV